MCKNVQVDDVQDCLFQFLQMGVLPWASKGDSAFRLVGASGGSYSSHWDVS